MKKYLMVAGKLQAVLFDWAGTTVDFGSRAPTRVVIEVFQRRGIAISDEEARGPMGLAKRDHLARVASLPRIAELWRYRYGHAPQDVDIDLMYEQFVPLLKDVLCQNSDVIPGVPEAVAACRRLGLKVGSTTGYSRELMKLLAPFAVQQGYEPDTIVCADEVSAGRPAPWMNFRAAELLGVYPLSTVVVVDDTPVGIEAGRNAGAWTVAVACTGNALGLSQGEFAVLAQAERASRLAQIQRDFIACGAHFVIPSVAELPDMLPALQARLDQRGAWV